MHARHARLATCHLPSDMQRSSSAAALQQQAAEGQLADRHRSPPPDYTPKKPGGMCSALLANSALVCGSCRGIISRCGQERVHLLPIQLLKDDWKNFCQCSFDTSAVGLGIFLGLRVFTTCRAILSEYLAKDTSARNCTTPIKGPAPTYWRPSTFRIDCTQ